MNTVILTSYFSKKKHPNHPGDKDVVGRGSDGFVENDSIQYILPWYNSVNGTSAKGFVFHDNLSDSFVLENTTENIKFIKVPDSIYSNNDYRFYCFRDFLLENQFDVVFHTDASDVTVINDPQELIKKYPNIDYFTCKDSIMLNQFGDYMSVHRHFNFEDSMNFMLNIKRWDLINMGVIGGSYKKMVEFYKMFCSVRDDMGNPEFNADMWVLQYLIRYKLQPCSFLAGDPVCSEFKKYQQDRKDVYFIHK